MLGEGGHVSNQWQSQAHKGYQPALSLEYYPHFLNTKSKLRTTIINKVTKYKSVINSALA